MLRFYPDTKIYIHCPAGVVTGGAELLHQLASFLRDNGKDAVIVYFGASSHEVPTDYAKYNIVTEESILDTEHCIEVLYEGIFDKLNVYKNTQKFLWWISVDNFFLCARDYLSLGDLFRWDKSLWWITFIQRTKQLLKGNNKFKGNLSIRQMVDMDIPCGYQAEYIQNFLHKCGFKELMGLKDYINTDHITPFEVDGRENIVVYNPKKGFEYTQRLIAMASDIKWVALQGMSREELVRTLRKAKIYIDFGYHPGKDRLPRECAMNGCCVITGMRGSAGFFEDVPLPSQYKFDERKAEIKDIVKQIRWTLENYESAIDDFKFYRNAIFLEKAEFEQQIRNIFLL